MPLYDQNLEIAPNKLILVDADSLCYASAFKETKAECFYYIEERLGEIEEKCNSTNLELWIEDWKNKDIFRNQVAVSKPYKGNRKSAEKPKWLIEAKEYLVNRKKAKVTQKYESEDMCLIRATEVGRDNCIIAYIDKDLLQAPFHFYNYRTREFISLDQTTADMRLYRQMMTGDSTDNIQGIYRFGPAKAKKAIVEDTENMPLVVATKYKENKYDYDYMVEQARLIYLIRHIDEATDYKFPVTKDEYESIIIEEKTK